MKMNDFESALHEASRKLETAEKHIEKPNDAHMFVSFLVGWEKRIRNKMQDLTRDEERGI